MSGSAKRRELRAVEDPVEEEEDLAPEANVVDTPEGKLPLPPLAMGVAQAPWVDGRQIIVLIAQLPGYGQVELKLEPQTARTIGRQLQEAGSAAESGLVLATDKPAGSLIVPGR